MNILDRLKMPIVLAPLTNKPSTPKLATTICKNNGLKFITNRYLTTTALEEQIAQLHKLTNRPFNMNLFVPNKPSNPSVYTDYAQTIPNGTKKPRYENNN